MSSTFLAAVTSAALALAPFQCASTPDPERALEDSAPASLYELAERFRAQGDDTARRQTLEYISERYPSSRWAQRAQLELGPPETALPVEAPVGAPPTSASPSASPVP